MLIWLSIIEIVKTHKKNLIFVSGEEKSDWFHRSEKQPLFPRFELINEFFEASEGKSIHIIKLSSLLTLFEADEKVVEEIAKEELNTNKKYQGNSAIIRKQTPISHSNNFQKGTLTIELVEDSFKGHVVGKLHSNFDKAPNRSNIKITSQPENNPSKISVIANTGTTYDFHVNLKSFEYNNPLKAGYYVVDFEFEYEENLLDDE